MKIKHFVKLIENNLLYKLNEEQKNEVNIYIIDLFNRVNYLSLEEFFNHYSKVKIPKLSPEIITSEIQCMSNTITKNSDDLKNLELLIESQTGPALSKIIKSLGGNPPKLVNNKKLILKQFLITGEFPYIEQKTKTSKQKSSDPQKYVDMYSQLTREASNLTYDEIRERFDPIKKQTIAVLKEIFKSQGFNSTFKRKNEWINYLLNHLESIRRDKIQRNF